MITIGELLEKLYAVQDREAEVIYDFCNLMPTKVESWRAVYAEPALGWKPRSYKYNNVTVAMLIEELEKGIDGRVYFGWKGGEYRYTKDSLLHVDNSGEWSDTALTGLIDCGYQVILTTKRED